MDNKTFILALRKIIREELKTVIKQELTEILKEGLKPTISEMKQPKNPAVSRITGLSAPKKKPMFEDNRWASILNETEALYEQRPQPMNSFAEMMNESVDEITMTSRDAQGFGMMRQNMQQAISGAPTAPAVMEDPETGKVYDVAPEVASALTRDYSALMKAIDKKKNM
jgi:beta-mannanase